MIHTEPLSLLALAVLALSSPASASAADPDLVARARARESAQLAELARSPVRVEAEGRASGGRRSRDLAWTREITYAPDGTVQVRQLSGSGERARGGRGVQLLGPLTLAPFSVPGAQIAVRPSPGPDGSVLVEVRSPAGGALSAVVVEVDPATGAKRALEVLPGGGEGGRVSEARARITFDADGAIGRLESHAEIQGRRGTGTVEVHGRRVAAAAQH
ncbi:conserved hypothetical protein [Anaeromyxobacter dehalogenans 2CP-1]|uniref:Outer membrane lipoprotein carrier protein LolA n=1 Tax=Anaeromyxobacter dehalogenans (strain ATCC BAA-258 / DSM 21875 / 2CP-1) TaxID=455488 RepID=B8JC22_ANAD2|nr:hypothetical protein [Anaeromyxobacter dehalogenans]ACL63944.1 conserved hypothetical protein [Anaeromyxobacter dehalogenans 2CP-1]